MFLFVLSFYAKRKYERRNNNPPFLGVGGYPLAPSTMNFNNIMRTFWISNGLREFWKIATVLKIAARAFCKQYCLSE